MHGEFEKIHAWHKKVDDRPSISTRTFTKEEIEKAGLEIEFFAELLPALSATSGEDGNY